MDNDVRLTESEAQLFADSICMNMNELELLNSLSSFISIGNASIEAEEMTCKVERGMVFTPASDRLSHPIFNFIRLRTESYPEPRPNFTYGQQPPFPLNR